MLYIPDNITIVTQKAFNQLSWEEVTEVYLFKDNGFCAVQILAFWKTKNAKLILVEEGLSLYALKGTYRLSKGNLPRVIYRWARRIYWYLRYNVWDSGEFGTSPYLSEIYLRDIESFQRIKRVSCKLVEHHLAKSTLDIINIGADVNNLKCVLLLMSPLVKQGYVSEKDQIRFIQYIRRICGNEYQLIVKMHPSERYNYLSVDGIMYLEDEIIPIEAWFGNFQNGARLVISQGSSASVSLAQLYGVRSVVFFPEDFFSENFLNYSEVLFQLKKYCEVFNENFVELTNYKIL